MGRFTFSFWYALCLFGCLGLPVKVLADTDVEASTACNNYALTKNQGRCEQQPTDDTSGSYVAFYNNGFGEIQGPTWFYSSVVPPEPEPPLDCSAGQEFQSIELASEGGSATNCGGCSCESTGASSCTSVGGGGSPTCVFGYETTGGEAPPEIPAVDPATPEDIAAAPPNTSTSTASTETSSTTSAPSTTVEPDGVAETTQTETTTQTTPPYVEIEILPNGNIVITDSNGETQTVEQTTTTTSDPNTGTTTTTQTTSQTRVNAGGTTTTVNGSGGPSVTGTIAGGTSTSGSSTTTTTFADGSSETTSTEDPEDETPCDPNITVCGSPGAIGRHAATELTYGQVFGDFSTTIGASPIISGATTFFQVSMSGTCPIWTIPATWIFPAMSVDMQCSAAMNTVFSIVSAIMIATAGFVAFRWAFL